MPDERILCVERFYVERTQLGWYGHVNRMDDKRIFKRVYEARETGKRPRGRPRKTWKEGLQEVTRKKGVTWKEVERTVKDREKWRLPGIPSTPEGRRRWNK